MDRDTLEGDLDLILGPQPNAEPVGEWDWEPPLGTTVPTASSAHEPGSPRRPTRPTPRPRTTRTTKRDD